MPNLNKDSYSFDTKIDAKTEANDAQNEAQKSSIHKRIINLIKENPRITRKQMAPSKTGHWEIVESKKED